MDSTAQTELEAAVFRRLIEHLGERKDVQNIELMILAGFCRNCLSKWYVEAASARGLVVCLVMARVMVHGMPFGDLKAHHLPPATDEQLERFEQAQKAEDS